MLQPPHPRTISIVVPVFNEEGAVRAFLNNTVPVLEETCRTKLDGGSYEILFVDDGSSDGTASAVMAEAGRNPAVKLIRFSRNFGKEAALAAGLEYAAGAAVIPMDVDLQDPPELIPRMVSAWLDGAEVVNAVRVRRQSDTWLKRTTANAFYGLYNRVSDIPIKANAGDFRLLDRAVVDVLNGLPESSRFSKGLYSWVGYDNTDIEYERPGRLNGSTKWPYRRLIRLALDGFIASTTAPLRIWSLVGLTVALLAFIYAGLLVLRTLIQGVDVPGYASIMVAVLFLGGLNLLSLGILGEYIGRISQEVRSRPLYIVRDTHGLEEAGGRRRKRARPRPQR